jgi:uncharacterized protein
MRFTQDSTSAPHIIRAYAPGEVRIDNERYHGTILLSASAVMSVPELRDANDLAAFDPSRIFALEPEVVLLGTGPRQVFPPAGFRARFLSAGIGIEVMDTGAACRTFNVLVGEQRRVVALLLV